LSSLNALELERDFWGRLLPSNGAASRAQSKDISGTPGWVLFRKAEHVRLHNIEIAKHRIIRNARVDLVGHISHPALKNLYGELAITLVAGRNGSGKSSLLSYVAQVFHHLERSPEKIPGCFSIEYSLASEGSTVKCKVYRRSGDKAVRLEVAGRFDKAITNHAPKRTGLRNGDILYADIKQYLPANVIVSAFSLSGEYPTERVGNFGGDRRLNVFDVSKLYGFNHFAFPSLSPALARLMERWQRDPGAVTALEVALGAKITGEVLVRDRERASYPSAEDEWVTFTPEILAQEAAGQIYINDILMTNAQGSQLTLQKMSSGQKFLLVRIVSILGVIQHNSLVIVEEPELHLDPTWSRQIISLLVSFFKDYKSHLLIATHSFSLLNAVPSDWVLVADGGRFGQVRDNTLLANESSLAGLLYAADSHVVEDRIRKYIHRASADQLEALFHILGESSTRYDVFRKIQAKTGRDA